MKTKKCSRCGVEKPLNEFYPRLLSKKDRVTVACKQCIAAYYVRKGVIVPKADKPYEYKPRKNEDTREKCNF